MLWFSLLPCVTKQGNDSTTNSTRHCSQLPKQLQTWAVNDHSSLCLSSRPYLVCKAPRNRRVYTVATQGVSHGRCISTLLTLLRCSEWQRRALMRAAILAAGNHPWSLHQPRSRYGQLGGCGISTFWLAYAIRKSGDIFRSLRSTSASKQVDAASMHC